MLGLVSADMMYPQVGWFPGWPFLQFLIQVFVLGLPLDRSISGLKKKKNFKMGGWLHPSTRGCAYLLEMVSTSSISLFSAYYG
jgi:hypothetical protein